LKPSSEGESAALRRPPRGFTFTTPRQSAAGSRGLVGGPLTAAFRVEVVVADSSLAETGEAEI
jgi:hypothetical protein